MVAVIKYRAQALHPAQPSLAARLAIALIEVGRRLIASSLCGMRSNMSDLIENFPHLAKQFHDLRDLLDTTKDPSKDDQRYDAGEQLEELIQHIRSLPGFDRFLLGELLMPAQYASYRIPSASGFMKCSIMITQKRVTVFIYRLEEMKLNSRLNLKAMPLSAA